MWFIELRYIAVEFNMVCLLLDKTLDEQRRTEIMSRVARMFSTILC